MVVVYSCDCSSDAPSPKSAKLHGEVSYAVMDNLTITLIEDNAAIMEGGDAGNGKQEVTTVYVEGGMYDIDSHLNVNHISRASCSDRDPASVSNRYTLRLTKGDSVITTSRTFDSQEISTAGDIKIDFTE